MDHLCALLCHDDDNVLISHVRVVLKGSSHAIQNEQIIMIYKGLVLYDPY